ncbi:hypothetical protein [Winogradskyella thalassocola]|uniref:Endonuclease n=1 Tax=Winogradskyella thalassocola TaxID=262004 RepID=A0A1G8GB24_9FLAO|nr:hypothetical protein [Winogradskyella thalassocola]SDH91565.1 hypothetical protein SAMN04489796_105153 [Winogradskyella thalassocola]
MKKKTLGFLMIILLTLTPISAQETVKVMFSNLLNSPLENSVPNRTYDLPYVLSDYKPDLVLRCELYNTFEASVLLNTTMIAINPNYDF